MRSWIRRRRITIPYSLFPTPLSTYNSTLFPIPLPLGYPAYPVQAEYFFKIF